MWQINAGSSFANWGINIGAASIGYILAPNTNAYNRLRLRFGDGLSFIPVGEVFRVIEIRRVPFKPDASISTNTNSCGSKIMTANTSNLTSGNLSYQWYLNGSAISGAIGRTYTTPNTGSASDYRVITTIDGTCSFSPTVRKDTADIHFNACVLPVDFGSIYTDISDSRLNIKWSTLSETNNDHFNIEVSKDGKIFSKIGEAVKSKAPNGNSSSVLNYDFVYSLAEVRGVLAGGIGVILILLAGVPLMFKINRGIKDISYLLTGAAVIVGATLYSCGKSNEDITKPDNIFVRIAQVDKDGSTKTSEVVRAFNK